MRPHPLLALACVSVVVVACDKPPEPPASTAASTNKPAPMASAPAPIATPTVSASATTSDSAASASASSTTTATGPTIELVPKTSFGPIKLGATKKEVEALGVLKVHPQYSGMTIPYTVYYDATGKAQRIQLTFKYAPGDVKVGTLTIPRTASFDDVKKLLGDCKDQPPATGGTTSKCRDGAVNVSIGSGSPTEVWLEAAMP